ncbi:hypothetical protein F5882DRAFT_510344 [Hyaloscypha sp. PMI_1271]|nr:hypothetical protein F5882DRAFT_510344 [Hyaloscypha sp. PMI_1271]
MDPLTAVGLAGNIITFIDLSTKVVSRAKQLYESASGATLENDELESLTKNLKDLADRTRHNISQQCIQVADELLETLESVKVKGDGRTLKSAFQAAKTVWKQDNIDAIQRRLDRISKQLMDGMSMEQLEEINRRLREMAVENTRLEANRSKEINQLREDFNSAIVKLKSNVEEEPTPGAWLILSDTARRGQAYFAEQVILQSLRFSSIESRHESISKEHSNTFSWIFDQASPTKFVEWLKGEDGVYWVSGKPGSGKSTLIKFLAGHDQTKSYLEEWAGDKKLVIANFYFWNASTNQSQKSQRGLLRTILYQILRQCPELIQMAYRDQWIALASDGKVLKESRDELLTVPALLKTLGNISTSTAPETKFCFFVDGLDEYDGRPADIIELVDILKSFQNVKTCVSSRPWNEFEDHFGADSSWKLYVQDFTSRDILLYVQETLGKNSRFQQLQKGDPECPNFVWDIVYQADGVFLWVFLVTRSLLDGLTNSDRIKDLQDRLNETPKDLRDYFKLILFSTENRYRTQTARIFTIAVNTELVLPLMMYWAIDQGTPKHVFQCPVETPATEILDSRLDNMRRRLKVLSKGLLNAEHTAPKSVEDYMTGFEVTFLHRTSMLQSWSDDTFNADWEICKALGALAKMTPPANFASGGPIIGFIFHCFILHAPNVDQNPLFQADIASLLEHLQTALAPEFQKNKEILVDYATYCRSTRHFLKTDILDPDILIMVLCVRCGIFNYVSEKVVKEPKLGYKVTNHVPALVWSMNQIPGMWDDVPPSEEQELAGVPMLEFFLARGVDPNAEFNGVTEWRIILEDLMCEGAFRRDQRSKSFEGLKLLLRHGADFQQQCKLENGGHIRTAMASELLREWYDADQFGVLEDIVKRREMKKKMRHRMSKKIGHLKLWVSSKK